MASALNYMILSWMLLSTTLTNGESMSNSPREYPSAKTELKKICVALSKSAGEQGMTLIFVLYVEAELEISLDFLWGLPRALIYMSDEDLVLGGKERDVVISWERDSPSEATQYEFFSHYWNPFDSCGHRRNGCESPNTRYVQHFRLEKRVLLQVREWSPSEDSGEIPEIIQHYIQDPVSLHYFGRFRAVFIIFRLEDEDSVHSQITVRRTGQTIGKLVLKVTAEEFSLEHIRSAFLPQDLWLNETDDFALEFQAATLLVGRKRKQRIRFGGCERVSWAAAYFLDKHDFGAQG